MAEIDLKVDPQKMESVGHRILSIWEDYRIRRFNQEQGMLKNHYQYRSQYNPEEMKSIAGVRENACQLYLGISRTKIRTLDARINEMALGAGRKNWTIAPTPEPDPTPDTLREAMEIAMNDPEKARLSKRERVRMATVARAERMENQMEDHLVESKYDELFRAVTHWGHEQAVGILKGPLVTKTSRHKWGQVMMANEAGDPAFTEWKMNESKIITPFFETVSPWDFYCEWSARRPQDSDFYFQRHLFTVRRMTQLKQNPSFIEKEVREWITRNYEEGDARWENWEQELYQNNSNQSSLPGTRRRWETIEAWGALTAEELLQLGMEKKMEAFGMKLDETTADMIEAHLWLSRSEGRVIGISLNPNADQSRPYSFYMPSPEEGHVYGQSPLEVFRDVQQGINGGFRMLMDNAATSVAPQIELRLQRLITPGDIKRMTPGRIWAVKEDPWNSSNPAIQFTDFPNHTGVFLSLIQSFQGFFDETAGIPRFQHGGGAGAGAGRTASGLAMLMGAAGQLVKDQLRAWDEFQAEVLTKLFNWEMQFNDREDIKGDHKIKVVTTSSILHKAERAQALREFRMSTLNPLDAPFTKRRDMLEEEAKELDLDPATVVKTKEDMLSDQEQMMVQQAMQDEAAAAAAPQMGEDGMPTGLPAPAGPQPLLDQFSREVPIGAAEGGYVNPEEEAIQGLEAEYGDILTPTQINN